METLRTGKVFKQQSEMLASRDLSAPQDDLIHSSYARYTLTRPGSIYVSKKGEKKKAATGNKEPTKMAVEYRSPTSCPNILNDPKLTFDKCVPPRLADMSPHA